MRIDIHSHFFPIDAFQNAGKFQHRAPKVTQENGRYSVVAGGGSRGNLQEGAYAAEARIRELDQLGIDVQALSPSPVLLYYWEEPDAAAYFARLQNEAIQAVVKAHPNRFIGLGTVPLQHIPLAIEVAEEAKIIGMKGLEIGTTVKGKPLDEREFEPFFKAAERLDLLLFFHPIEASDSVKGDSLTGLLNAVTMFPYQTTVAIERLILKGLFEKLSDLRVCLSHGGGFLPYNIWRLDHAYSQRKELKKGIPERPSEYLKRIYFDSIVHSPVALEFLINVVGPERVIVGSDYPMLMGDDDPISKIMALPINEKERELITEQNALRALRMDKNCFC
jgi:aminocarboxymuconate-semialdehyde decarboxylase